MEALLERLQEKNIEKLTANEATELLKIYSIEKEVKTSITGPIQILRLDKEQKLILENDQKGNNYVRIINNDQLDEFITERLSIYEKMWDGCGCKVFYDEVWSSSKNTEINL